MVTLVVMVAILNNGRHLEILVANGKYKKHMIGGVNVYFYACRHS